MSEQNTAEEAEVQRRAREIYERLQREHHWEFLNIPPAPPPQPAAPAESPSPRP